MLDKQKRSSSLGKDEERSFTSKIALAVPPSFANAALHRHLWEEVILNDYFYASARLRGLPASSTFTVYLHLSDFFSQLFGVFFAVLAYGLSTNCPLSGCIREPLLVPAKPLRYVVVQLRL
jgi:hypothetical protein